MSIIRELISMQATAYLDRARTWSRSLEDREAARIGQPVHIARERVSRRTGVSPGTLENLRNGRLKAIAVHVYDRLRSAVAAELEAELVRLQHELEFLQAAGFDADQDQVGEVEAHLAAARRALGKGEAG